VRYLVGSGSIVVEFASGSDTFYKYTHISAGQSAIEEMVRLAKQGQGLNSYIRTNKPPYASKGTTLNSL